ncbi:MAG: hypothetical protein ABSA23_06105 [Anaerolineales bacterium]
MALKPKFKSITLLDFYKLFLGLAILEGFLALWWLFRVPSEARNTFLANFSLQRISLGFVIIVVLGVFIFALVDSFKSQKLLAFLNSRLATIFDFEINHTLIKTALIFILTSSLASLLFYWFPDLQRLIFFLPNNYIFTVLGERAGLLIGWIALISLQSLILYAISGIKANHPITTPVRLMVVSWMIEIFVFVYFALWSLIARKLALDVLLGPGVKILILSIWFSLWAYLNKRKDWAGRIFLLVTCISIWLCVFIVSLQFAQWFDRWNTPDLDLYNQLAYAFLRGKMYLINPTVTDALTYFKGHYFVPGPPFPAIIMLPFVAALGIQGFNTTTFSIVLAAASAVIVYLILHSLIHAGWIKLSRSGAIWLTALFSFGTMYWYLSIDSRKWYFAQVVTVLFCGLAFLSVLRKWSPWFAGICLAAAILCRPDVFTLWPALLAIAIQQNLDGEKKIKWKEVIKWGVQSAIPVVIGAGILFSYNYLNYGSFSDFEYGNINGAFWIIQNVQKYGLFSTHFMASNLNLMFLVPPPLTAACGYFLTRNWGMSIFATTPAIIYLFRRLKISWWTVGCWCSILLTIIVLSLYSNNGSQQYGFRYMLDFMIPMIMLIACNAGERISAPLKTLIIASILINYYGTLSWFRGPC